MGDETNTTPRAVVSTGSTDGEVVLSRPEQAFRRLSRPRERPCRNQRRLLGLRPHCGSARGEGGAHHGMGQDIHG